MVAGADEVGRGCLAGPLVAAAVLFSYRPQRREWERPLEGLDDSKRLSPAARKRLFAAILEAAVRVWVVVVPAAESDRIGLQAANLVALRRALEGACEGVDPPPLRLVDGFKLPGAPSARQLLGGDRTSAAVAAASVVAKVVRDRHMELAGRLYPGWGFERHVGYPTPGHREAIARLGLSPLHRRSFRTAALAPAG
jgi:ribonuclease HII